MNNILCLKKIKTISVHHSNVPIGANFETDTNLYKILSFEEAREIATKELELPFSFMRTVYFCNTELARFDFVNSKYSIGDTIALQDISPNDLGIENIN
jgi:hypothetical protein